MAIQHDSNGGRFFTTVEGLDAELSYRRHGQVLDFYRVYVPEPLRKRGLAGQVTIAAFDFARANGFKVTPSCPFVSGQFLPRFPQYQDLIVQA